MFATRHLTFVAGKNQGRLLVFFAGVLWSLAGVLIKFLDVPPVALAGYRCAFAGLLFLPAFMQPHVRPPFRWEKGVAAILYLLVVSWFVMANKMTTSANAIILQYTAPAFVMVWSVWWLKEALDRKTAACLMIAFAGVAVIVGGENRLGDRWGIAVALASGVAFSWYMVFQKRLAGESPARLIGGFNLFTAAVLLPWMMAAPWPSASQWGILAVMGVVQLGLPYLLFARGLQTISPQEASLITLVEPVLNPVWVYLVCDERPSTATLVGGACIVSALLARWLWELRAAKP